MMDREELKGIIKEIILERLRTKDTNIRRFSIIYAHLLKFVLLDPQSGSWVGSICEQQRKLIKSVNENNLKFAKSHLQDIINGAIEIFLDDNKTYPVENITFYYIDQHFTCLEDILDKNKMKEFLLEFCRYENVRKSIMSQF